MFAVLSYLPGVRERAVRLLTELSTGRKPSHVAAREIQIRIRESFRMEKNSKIILSSHKHNTAKFTTKLCP